MSESSRDRGLRVSQKALAQIATVCGEMNIEFMAVMRTGTTYQIYCGDMADVLPLCEVAETYLGAAPEGVPLN